MSDLTPAQQTANNQYLIVAQDINQRLRNVKVENDCVIFVFGGQEYPIPSMVFNTTERVWDMVGEVAAPGQSAKDRIRKILELVSIASQAEGSPSPLTVEQMGSKLKGQEWPALSACYTVLLIESGLLDRETVIAPLGNPEDSNMGEDIKTIETGKMGAVDGSQVSSSGSPATQPTAGNASEGLSNSLFTNGPEEEKTVTDDLKNWTPEGRILTQ
jgi:hypothetical protein